MTFDSNQPREKEKTALIADEVSYELALIVLDIIKCSIYPCIYTIQNAVYNIPTNTLFRAFENTDKNHINSIVKQVVELLLLTGMITKNNDLYSATYESYCISSTSAGNKATTENHLLQFVNIIEKKLDQIPSLYYLRKKPIFVNAASEGLT